MNAMAQGIKTFVFLDLEATGLPSSRRPRITEICLLAVHRCLLEASSDKTALPRVVDKLNTCVCPMKPVSAEAANITGLHNDLLEYQKDFDPQLVESINLFLKRHEAPICLVAHNGVNFDFGLLLSEYESLDAKLPEGILCVDSLNMLREIDEALDYERGITTDNEKCVTRPSKIKNYNDYSESNVSDLNKVKRKLFFPSENINNKNETENTYPETHSKKSSLFDPIDEPENTMSNGQSNTLNKSINSPVEMEIINKAGIEEHNERHSTSEVESSQKSDSCLALDQQPIRGEQNAACNFNKGRSSELLKGEGDCAADSAGNGRSVSPGMLGALHDMVETGEFDEIFPEEHPKVCDRSQCGLVDANLDNEVDGEVNKSVFSDIGPEAETIDNRPVEILDIVNGDKASPCDSDVQSHSDIVKSPPRVQRISDKPFPLTEPSSTEFQAENVNTPSPSSRFHSTELSSNSELDGKSSSVSKTPSPWYTPTRLSNVPFKKYKYSYKLTDVHKRVVGWVPEKAHTAEDDCMALLRVCQKLCSHVCKWADENAVSLEKIPPLYSKSPKKRTPLSEGVLPYRS